MWQIKPRFANLGAAFYSQVQPLALTRTPRVVHLNRALIKQLALDQVSDDEWRLILSGRQTIANYSPLASVYMGHQFGVLVPKLGDGRALLIAEHADPGGQIWELQLKGSGPTPYSRMGDGRAVLRSSIREYLGSHALTQLGVATTQALGILTSNDPVYREQVEPAAVILRVAPSFIRFGHFEYFAHHGLQDELQQLLQFCARHYFPQLKLNDPDLALAVLDEVVAKTARMLAQWQAIGFVHGVMNSDNMSILGLTLDYGPFAFCDSFAPQQIFNHSDSSGRYTYANQPHMAWWNLYRLAEAFAGLGHNQQQLETVLAGFVTYYNDYYTALMAQKLGFLEFRAEDGQLIAELFQLLEKYQVDWTYFWRKLSYGQAGYADLRLEYPDFLGEAWWQQLQLRYAIDKRSEAERNLGMQAVNPALVARTSLLHGAIQQAMEGDYSEVERLFRALTNPYQEDAAFTNYYQPQAAGAAACELSCSS